MRMFLKTCYSVVCMAALLGTVSVAQAQEFTVRVEPGVAVPLTKPQTQLFTPGAAVDVKPEVTLGHYVGLGPSLSYMVLGTKEAAGTTTPGTALGVGGFVTVKRPHDELNTGTGLTAVAPWVDADLQYVRTGDLDRMGWSVGAGASVPTGSDRSVWVGPFVRYQDIHEAFTKTDVNTNESKTLIAGVSFEFGAPAKKPTQAPTQQPPQNPVALPPPAPTPPAARPAVHHHAVVDLKQTIQFAFDSAVLDVTAQTQLSAVVNALAVANSYRAIHVEGHASSEGESHHNDNLSQQRANAVLDYLAAHGVDRSKLSAEGFGSRVPVGDNHTQTGRVANRRAEFEVRFVLSQEAK